MKPLEQLLPPSAFLFLSRLEHALSFAKEHRQPNESVYLVGGTARLLASGLVDHREVTDIDILVTNSPAVVTKMSEILRDSSELPDEPSSCAGQKFEVGSIKCDIFGNDFKKWLAGAPCFGDMLAIDFFTGRTHVSNEFLTRAPYDVNPNQKIEGEKAIGYMKEHRNKLARDVALVQAIRDRLDKSGFDHHLGELV